MSTNPASTRLVVKGLPAQITEAQLRKTFEPYGELTDVRLKLNNEGKSRRFAFIGFASPEEARNAAKAMHNGFIRTTRIVVEECRPLTADAKTLVPTWKLGNKKETAHPSPSQSNSENQDLAAAPSTAKLDALISRISHFVMSEEEGGVDENRRRLSLIFRGLPPSMKPEALREWLLPMRMKTVEMAAAENESFAIVTFERQPDVRRALKRNGQSLEGNKIEIMKLPSSAAEEKGQQASSEKTPKTDSSATPLQQASEQIMETGRLFLRNLPYLSTSEVDLRALLEKFGTLADLQCIVDRRTGQSKGYAMVSYVFPEHALRAYCELDGSIYKGRMLHVLPGEEAKSKADEGGGGRGEDFALSKFQKERQQARKRGEADLRNGNGQSRSWNTLFLGPNAVAEAVAEKLEVEKRHLMVGDEETSAAIRLAMAESRLVRETRDFLIAQGVRLDAFSRPPTKRSATTLLVKNLPSRSQPQQHPNAQTPQRRDFSEELQRMFARFGPVKRVVLPPEGLTAIVEMVHIEEARRAFKALAYAKLRHQPMYLEWAPEDIFIDEVQGQNAIGGEKVLDKAEGESNQEGEEGPSGLESSKRRAKLKGSELTEEEKRQLRRSKRHGAQPPQAISQPEDSAGRSKTSPTKQASASGGEEAAAQPSVVGSDGADGGCDGTVDSATAAALFVKNLSFSTTDEQLYALFAKRYGGKEGRGKVASAVVSRKCDPKEPTKTLSMGFGFVHFERIEDANDALKEMQGILLNGHSLELKLSTREQGPKGDATAKRMHKGGAVGEEQLDANNFEQGDSTKLLVRNIPFQANLKELTQLFSTFGELKMIRLPNKLGPRGERQHRGFCFVDYLAKSDAARAMAALVHSTHLYGRRLVLEWAKQDASVVDMIERSGARAAKRTKTAAGKDRHSKAAKKRLQSAVEDGGKDESD